MAKVDPAAIRNTQDVDILIRRDDFEAVKAALASDGFVYRHAESIDMFLDGPAAKDRDAVHIDFAGERVRPDALAVSPKITETAVAQTSHAGRFAVVTLEALVQLKLTSYRDKDRIHLRGLIEL